MLKFTWSLSINIMVEISCRKEGGTVHLQCLLNVFLFVKSIFYLALKLLCYDSGFPSYRMRESISALLRTTSICTRLYFFQKCLNKSNLFRITSSQHFQKPFKDWETFFKIFFRNGLDGWVASCHNKFLWDFSIQALNCLTCESQYLTCQHETNRNKKTPVTCQPT